MDCYVELIQQQQEEVNALPLGYAFGSEQFAEMMKKWGLDPERDIDQVYPIGGGCYVQKKDVELMRQTFARHHAELSAAIAADSTGGGFVYQMFLYELNNHEYGYTWDASEALGTLGYTLKQVREDKRLWNGFQLACAKIAESE